jgi:hypothetical protein
MRARLAAVAGGGIDVAEVVLAAGTARDHYHRPQRIRQGEFGLPLSIDYRLQIAVICGVAGEAPSLLGEAQPGA